VRLTLLALTDFRCYEAVEIEPAQGLTAIVGGNGQGKTSLLEAVGWLASGRSFRGVPDGALVRDGAERAIVRGALVRDGRDRLIEAEVNRSGRNRILVNRQPVPRIAALQETLRVTVFSPDDLDLVKGGPALRRAFLDALLADLSPRLLAAASEYERILRQRNALLRGGMRGPDDASTLDVWDARLADAGGRLAEGRLRLIDRLSGPLAKAYDDLAAGSIGAGSVTGEYRAEWCDHPVAGDPAALTAALADAVVGSRRREIERGTTLVGPHRDDWHLEIGGRDARTHASQGEQRSLALALRLAGHEVVTDAVGDTPVLMLDDVFSELDPGRCRALVEHLPPGQALVTTASILPEGLAVDLRLAVAEGRVEAA